ncbi:hypothetical protein HHI36_010429 [Cryptolaemus montrouzieri]|uniref:TIP41-like protein n=1 Tax=Cryptolaemus montrouzieri TaxID=559131 RepID=A0ABD2MIS1_9CUCU
MSMSEANLKDDGDIQRLPVNSELFTFNNWIIKYTKSHILHSGCTTPESCKDPSGSSCLLCIYNKTLDLPHLPEMVFPNALKTVSNGKFPIKVAYSEAWKETRSPDHLEEKIKPFDWTFSNDYKGTLSKDIVVESTNERIDIEKLKVKEKILFYQELMLYEDELHDNGISSCTIKIRVMPSCFFILLRFFLRVDNVMIRVNDTRYYHDFTTDYVIREFSNKECAFSDVKLPLTSFGDPNLLAPHMPLRTAQYEKLTFPKGYAEVDASNGSTSQS